MGNILSNESTSRHLIIDDISIMVNLKIELLPGCNKCEVYLKTIRYTKFDSPQLMLPTGMELV